MNFGAPAPGNKFTRDTFESRRTSKPVTMGYCLSVLVIPMQKAPALFVLDEVFSSIWSQDLDSGYDSDPVGQRCVQESLMVKNTL